MVTIEIGPDGIAHWDGSPEFEFDSGGLSVYARAIKSLGDHLSDWAGNDVDFSYGDKTLSLTVEGIDGDV